MKFSNQIIINVPASDVESAIRAHIIATRPQLSTGFVINPKGTIGGLDFIADGGEWNPPEPAVVSPGEPPAALDWLRKANKATPVFGLKGKELFIRAGTKIIIGKATHGYKTAQPIRLPKKLTAGEDYAIYIRPSGSLRVGGYDEATEDRLVGGFHFNLNGAIQPNSFWDQKFKPAAKDPRGMVLIGDRLFWADIYLMNRKGQSRAGAEIADGYQYLPEGYDNLNYHTATKILAEQGKQLFNRDEFALAAAGVTEGKATGKKQLLTALFPGLESKAGLQQATGTIHIWSRDLEKEKYPWVLGGAWGIEGNAGSRYAFWNIDPSYSYSSIGARGRCDHLELE